MMYTMLLFWFFCIAFCSMATITLTISRMPLKQAPRANSVIAEYHDSFCNKCGESFAVHNDDGSCIEDSNVSDSADDFEDETDENEMDNLDDEDTDEITEPSKIPRTGKVTMLAENLAKCLNIVKDTVGCRTLPILNKVKIDFKDGMATFTTTNLETMTVTSCGCKIESEFSCVLPFKILKDLSELLYDDIVTLEQSTFSGNTYDEIHRRGYSNVPTILIKQERQTVTLFDGDPQDYPPIPKVEGESVVISELSETIKKIKDKIVKAEYQNLKFAGLYFDLSRPNIVTTDGYKMKITKLECEPKPMQFRIDKECALLLAKFKDMDCLITSNENQTRFDFGEYMRGTLSPSIYHTIITQNLQGTYPDYEALKESNKEAVSVL